jgi:ribonuclease Z
MDHFIGFDALLRVSLGRSRRLHLFGPPDFHHHVEGKLAGYTWNLVHEYEAEFELAVSEVHHEMIHTKTYFCRDRFQVRGSVSSRPFSGTLLEKPSFSVLARLLDHRIPCLGLSVVERFSVHIVKERLKALGLPVGAWLSRFKSALYEGLHPDEEFVIQWEDKGKAVRERRFRLGDLTQRIAKISPGQKLVYVTDVAGTADNLRQIISFAQGADLLFIEAAFLDSEREMAQKKYHLTARQAGEIAGGAGVRQFRLFHFSPRYKGRSEELEKEAMEAYRQAAGQMGAASSREPR